MIIYNRKPVDKILFNKKQVKKILLNKKLVYDNGLNPDDYAGTLNFKLPEIDGISDYFIFCLLSHYPITKADSRFQIALQDLADLRISYNKESDAISPVRYSNFTINNIPASTPGWIGEHIGDYVNNSSNLNVIYTADRVVVSKYGKGLIAFLEGTHEHFIPSECIGTSFGVAGTLSERQILSAFLIGQSNLDLPEGYEGREYEPLEYVACDIDFKMDNNLVGNSAYNVYTYCIKNDGTYKLLSMNANYDRNTNILSFKERLRIFDIHWFDDLPGS